MSDHPHPPIPVQPDPAAFAASDRFMRATRRIRRLDLIRAEACVEIRASKIYKLEGSGSVVEYAARLGVRPWITFDLLALGDLLAAHPQLKEPFLAGNLSLRAAATLQRILEVPGEPAEPWIQMAHDLSTRDFCSEVKDRMAERRVGRPPVHVHLRLGAGGYDDFRRARVLLQRKSDRAITLDETAETCFSEYLDRNDPLRIEGRERRMPDTRGTPGRTVAREVSRDVRQRDRERCTVPACPNEVYLHLGHLEAHAEGGSRESDNLFLLCSQHNQMMEQGLLIVKGTVEAPEFFDKEGRPYTEGTQPRRRAPPARRRPLRGGHAPGEPPKPPPASSSASPEQEPEP
jgi:hypothetical protein